MMKQTPKKVQKQWGYELWLANNEENNYCGKILHVNSGHKFSMHFHKEKDETWFVNSGVFKVAYIDTKDSTLYEKELKEGEVWRNPPLQPHQLICLTKEGSVTEVSTPDSVEDNYRIGPGDSQVLDETDNAG